MIYSTVTVRINPEVKAELAWAQAWASIDLNARDRSTARLELTTCEADLDDRYGSNDVRR